MDSGEMLRLLSRYAGPVCGYDREKDLFIFSICGQTQTFTGPLARGGIEGSVERLVREAAEYRRDALVRELTALELAVDAIGGSSSPSPAGRDRARVELGEMIERCRRRIGTLEQRLSDS